MAQKKRRPQGRFFVILLLLLTLIAGTVWAASGGMWQLMRGEQAQATPSPEPTVEQAQATPTPEPTPQPPVDIQISVVGDVMTHDNQIKSAKNEDGTYSFEDVFATIAPTLSRADLTLANLETTCAGEAARGYTGYPTFNSPETLLNALKGAGVDVLTLANNHICDRKKDGLINTVQNVADRGFMQTGAFATQEDAEKILIADVKGVKVAILAYSYAFNGMEETIPQEDRSWMLNQIDMGKIKRNIKKAKEEGADVVICCVHWGEEYTRQPNATQKKQADEILSLGCDIIFGSHPHMLQPIERRTVTNSDGSTREALVVWSLGNFLSDQRAQYKDTGMMVEVNLQKDMQTGAITIGEVGYTPTYVARTPRSDGLYNYRIVPSGQYDQDEILQLMDAEGKKRVAQTWSEATTLIGSEAAEPRKD